MPIFSLFHKGTFDVTFQKNSQKFLPLCAELQMECTRFLLPASFRTRCFFLWTHRPILSMGIPSFLIKYCNASAPAYYDSIWFVTRTRHSRSNLLNRIFITRGRRTVYSSSAWLTKETVHPLPSHYNKNKHSLRGFLYASGAMLILYQIKEKGQQCPVRIGCF